MTQQTDDLRIAAIKEVIPPVWVHEEYPVTDNAADTIIATRAAIRHLLHGKDDRMLAVVGPCSIHDPVAAREYAGRLKALRDELKSDLEIVMRVYFEKPRTTVGWKGLINDPDLDNSFNINKGLKLARSLLSDLNDMGMPAGTEYLDLISPQYVADLISWGAIGARTTESQVHRELSSGLSCPVGFKNGTDGNLKIAIDAIGSASKPHHFLSVTKSGQSAIFETTGNENCHVILRGGKEPNYDAASVEAACAALAKAGLPEKVMIDYSHANSAKQHKRQMDVNADVAGRVAKGEDRVFGIMIESHLVEGNQSIGDGTNLTYGQSVTDACLNWSDTEQVLRDLAAAVKQRRG